MMNERDAVEAVAAAVHATDPSATVTVTARESLDAQHGRRVTIGVLARPNHHELVDALVKFCVESAGDFRLERSALAEMGEVTVDIIEVSATVYTKI